MRTRSSWVIRCVRGMTRTLEVRDRRPGRGHRAAARRSADRGRDRGGARAGPADDPAGRAAPARRREAAGPEDPALLRPGRRTSDRVRGVPDHPRPRAVRGHRRHAEREPVGGPGVVPGLAADRAHLPAAGAARAARGPAWPSSSSTSRSRWTWTSRRRRRWSAPDRGRSFRIDGDRVRSETTIELQWVRGRLFEVELDLGPGLEVVSVGPTAVVEAWNPTGGPSAGGPAAAGAEPRGLTIRLAPPVRDQSQVTLQLQGYQRLPREGPVKLGLFAPDETTAVSCVVRPSPATAASRSSWTTTRRDPAGPSASRSGRRSRRPDRSDLLGRRRGRSARHWPSRAVGSPRTLPDPDRAPRPDAPAGDGRLGGGLPADRSTCSRRRRSPCGTGRSACWRSASRPPSSTAGSCSTARSWTGRSWAGSGRVEATTACIFDRPVSDRTTLAFRLPAADQPAPGCRRSREVAVPWITFPEAAAGPARVELTPTPGVVFARGRSGLDPRRGRRPGRSGRGIRRAVLHRGVGRHRASLRASGRWRWTRCAMPALLVPRLLIRSSRASTTRSDTGPGTGSRRTDRPSRSRCPSAPGCIAVAGGGPGSPTGSISRHAGRDRLIDSGCRPTPPPVRSLVELEYQLDAAAAGSPLAGPAAPRTTRLVLQTLWEARLPWDRALLGVPRGWSDENEWYWAGNLWIRRPDRGRAGPEPTGCSATVRRPRRSRTCARATSTSRSTCSSAGRPAVPANRRTWASGSSRGPGWSRPARA